MFCFWRQLGNEVLFLLLQQSYHENPLDCEFGTYLDYCGHTKCLKGRRRFDCQINPLFIEKILSGHLQFCISDDIKSPKGPLKCAPKLHCCEPIHSSTALQPWADKKCLNLTVDLCEIYIRETAIAGNPVQILTY